VTAGEKELLTALKRVQFSLICRTIVWRLARCFIREHCDICCCIFVRKGKK
jgi:hypothetical protein